MVLSAVWRRKLKYCGRMLPDDIKFHRMMKVVNLEFWFVYQAGVHHGPS